MRTPTSILILVVLCGCEPDLVNMGRRDTGVVPDSGLAGTLPLQPGMTFTYQGMLTYRSDAIGEQSSLYQLTVTIVSVDDQGAEGESSLEFTAVGTNTLDDEFQETSDFDLWVARLGPSQRTDLMAPTAVHETLADPPRIPPPPSPPPKQLPQPGSFFIDVRTIDAITGAFIEAHQGQQPQVLAPMGGSTKWSFSFMGEDPSIFYYPNKTRSVRLEYDPSGWLTRIDEDIGVVSSNSPSANARLILMSGP